MMRPPLNQGLLIAKKSRTKFKLYRLKLKPKLLTTLVSKSHLRLKPPKPRKLLKPNQFNSMI